MPANLCVEAHLREFLEHGFEVVVVKVALPNLDYLANDVITTGHAIRGDAGQA